MYKKLLVSIFSLAISLLAAEAVLRLYEYKTQGIPINQKIFIHEDPLLGWAGEMTVSHSGSGAFRIFIIGDSFTEGNGVPENERYYSWLRKKLNADVYVYAAAGYSTTQEYLVLKKYLHDIKPDLLIIQVCNNDVIDNTVALETRSLINNNHRLRPYLTGNAIRLLYPSRFGWISYGIVKHSRLALRSMIAVDILLREMRAKAGMTSVEEHIGETRYARLYEDATAVTKQLMDRMRHAAGDVPIVFFPVDTYPELNAMLRNNVPNSYWIDSPAREIDRLRALAAPVVQADGSHWNARGHSIVGSLLLRELIDQNIIPDRIVVQASPSAE